MKPVSGRMAMDAVMVSLLDVISVWHAVKRRTPGAGGLPGVLSGGDPGGACLSAMSCLLLRILSSDMAAGHTGHKIAIPPEARARLRARASVTRVGGAVAVHGGGE